MVKQIRARYPYAAAQRPRTTTGLHDANRALSHLTHLVCLDEIHYKKWQGETIALEENTKLRDTCLRKLYFDSWVSYDAGE